MTHASCMKNSFAGNKSYCNSCLGYCCYKLKGATLLIKAVDINRIAQHLQTTDGDIRRRFLADRHSFKTKFDGSCIFLANDRMSKRCSIHEAKPDQCRSFPYKSICPYLDNEILLAELQQRIQMISFK